MSDVDATAKTLDFWGKLIRSDPRLVEMTRYLKDKLDEAVELDEAAEAEIRARYDELFSHRVNAVAALDAANVEAAKKLSLFWRALDDLKAANARRSEAETALLSVNSQIHTLQDVTLIEPPQRVRDLPRPSAQPVSSHLNAWLNDGWRPTLRRLEAERK